MVIDESTARAYIKKHVKVFNRRTATLSSQNFSKQSKKQWLKYKINYIESTSWVIDKFQTDKNIMNFMSLTPSDDDNNFVTMLITINLKKMSIKVIYPDLIFTNHFLARLMQYRKTLDLTNLVEDMNHVIELLTQISMKVEADNEPPDTCYDLYDDRMGFIPIFYDSKQKIIAKTLIPPKLMGYKHNKNYKVVMGTNNFKILKNL